MLKELLKSSLIIAGLFSSQLFAQDLPMPSPTGTSNQTVGLTEIEITYSRPGVKGREIYGALVPYNEIWRTGANKATAISFSDDVKVGGSELKAGVYALFTIPGEKEWEIIFNSNTEQWGAGGHKAEEDVLRIKVNSEASDFTESMLFYFNDLKNNSASLNLQWEKTRVSIPIEVDSEGKSIENIEAAIKEAEGGFRTYRNAARYFIDNDKDAKKALDWAQKSVDMDKRYWNLTTLAKAQAKNEMYKEAIKTAEEAKTLSEAAKSEHYIKVNTENIESWKSKK